MLDKYISANRYRSIALLVSAFLILTVSLGALYVLFGGGTGLLAIFALIAIAGPWVAYYSSDKVVIRATRARDADPEEYAQLHAVVEEMAIASGLPKPRVMIVQDPAPNAFATGRNEDNAVIGVTTGLLEKMDREQLQSVIGHEMAHILNKDMFVATLAASVAGAIIVLSDIGIRATLLRSRDSNVITLVIALVALILAPIAAALLKASISRKRETLADYTSAKLTRNPAGMRRALEELQADTGVLQNPSRVSAHLWIEEPTPQQEGASGWLRRIFATHPPLPERIDAMSRLESGRH